MIPPAAANPLPAPAPGVDSDGADQFPWRAFTRRGLRNQVLCAGIALLIWLVTSGLRGNLLSAWVCSAAIGTSSWFFFDGSRLLLAGWLPQTKRLPGARRVRWPGPGWMLLCIVGGTALGYTVGSAIGDAVTGFSTPSLLDDRPALATSLVAAIAATGYFYVTERLHQEQANAETARRAVTESQLRLLQSQLEPHRLFNTLANLRLLVTLDPPRAQAILDRLIGDLRATLGASRQDLHPLADEFTMFDDYLALMSMRMGPRLQVQLSLPEALRHLPVPPLLLQPPPMPTALIAEDEPQLAAALQADLARLWPALRIVATVGDGLSATAQAQALALRPQLCFSTSACRAPAGWRPPRPWPRTGPTPRPSRC